MSKIQTIDIVNVSIETAEQVYQYIKAYIESRSTTRLLATGAVSLLVIQILKQWLNMFRVRRQLGIKSYFPLPLIGTMYKYTSFSFNDLHLDQVKNLGKMSLTFEGATPVINTADPEFIKLITIKDFHHFTSRRVFPGVEYIKPFGEMISSLKDEEWKRVRSIITSAFTAGKLKKMTGSILSTCDIFTAHLETLIAKNETMDAKLYSCFATDVVCSNFFGVNVDTVNNPDHVLPKNIGKVFGTEFLNNPRILLLLFFPTFAEFLIRNNLMEFIDTNAMGYLNELSNQIIEERRSKKVHREDFIQMMVDHEQDEDKGEESLTSELVEAKNSYKHLRKTLSNEEIIAQSVAFMMAGSDTTAQVLTFVSYSLAMNPECQDKLIDEIDQVLENFDGELNYESVNKMDYLSSAISETQRMYSVSQTDRMCTQDYTYNGMKIKKGQSLIIQIYAMSHNPEVFTEPFKFLPERERPSDHFIQFGSGLRTCVAMRFAILEVKFLLVSILRKFRFEKCEKTVETVTIDNSGLTKPKYPIILKVVRREN